MIDARAVVENLRLILSCVLRAQSTFLRAVYPAQHVSRMVMRGPWFVGSSGSRHPPPNFQNFASFTVYPATPLCQK